PRRHRRGDRLHRGPHHAVLVDRVQEGPPPVLHGGLQELGTRARRRVSVSLRDTKSAELYARAQQYLPGGVNSPVRAMRAIGRAPAATGREKLLKFAGAYHGHVDGLLADAGSGLATQGIPASPGVTAAATASTIIVPWNDADAVAAACAEHEFAAILAEP